MEIDIKQKHLNEGKKWSPEYCPVALAIREQMPGISDVKVGAHYIDIEIFGRILNFEMTPSTQKFITSVDTAKDLSEVKPTKAFAHLMP